MRCDFEGKQWTDYGLTAIILWIVSFIVIKVLSDNFTLRKKIVISTLIPVIYILIMVLCATLFNLRKIVCDKVCKCKQIDPTEFTEKNSP